MSGADRPGAHLRVEVGSAEELRARAVALLGTGSVRALTVRVGRWRAPFPGWSGRLGPVTHLRELDVRLPEDDGEAVIGLRVGEDHDAGRLVAAVVPLLVPFAGPHGPLSAAVAVVDGADPELAPLLVDLPLGVWPAGERQSRHARRADVAALSASADMPGEVALTLRPGPGGPRTRDEAGVERSWPWAAVDPAVQRPVGRSSPGTGAVVGAEATPAGPVATVDGRRVPLDPTDPARVSALGSVGAVAVPADVAVEAGALARLSACGIVVHAPAASAEGDGPLAALWGLPLPEPDDVLGRQVAAVRQLRAAHRHHGVPALRGRIAAEVPGLAEVPSVSVLLVTNRPERLARIRRHMAALDYPRLQVVLGLHGDHDVTAVARDWAALDHDVVTVAVPASWSLGAALGAVSARADGDLLTKVDDDDHYGPDHVWDLVLARSYSGAQVVGKTLDFIHLEGLDITVLRPTHPAECYARFVCGGTILVSRADLDAVGGWRPVPRGVDRTLLDRILDDGGLVYRTHGLGYLYVRHADGHTWDVTDGNFLRGTTRQWWGLLSHEEFGTQDADR